MRDTNVLILGQSLGKGGAERFAAILSKMLSELNCNVFHALYNNEIDYEFQGDLLNLEEKGKSNFKIIQKFKKSFLLYQYIRKNNIHIVIDVSTQTNILKPLFLKIIFGKTKKYRVVQNYEFKKYIPENKLLARLIYANFDKIVCVSKQIELALVSKYKFKNTSVIYNSFENKNFENFKELKEVPEKYILFFGRFEEKSKNFTLLLNAYNDSKLYLKGIGLVLMGKGDDEPFILKTIQNLNLQLSVTILPYTSEPSFYIKNAMFVVLTSNYEGFPLSIIESLHLDVPVVAVNCKSGPSEVIINEFNGLLVDSYQVKDFSEALQRMSLDVSLNSKCKQNAKKSVEVFSYENVKNEWGKLLF